MPLRLMDAIPGFNKPLWFDNGPFYGEKQRFRSSAFGEYWSRP